MFTDKGVTLNLFGIKNDYMCDGFEINIVKAECPKICPVRALQSYVNSNGVINRDPFRPVFTPLS